MPKTIHTPSADDLRLAAQWCEGNEGGENSEEQALKRVALWLEQQADAKELRDAAKEHGVPVDKLRAAITRQPRTQC